MAASISSSSEGAFVPAYAGWSKEETTEDNVQKLMVSKFTEIVSDYDRRKQSDSVNDLEIGPWYPNDYARALQAHKQTARLKFLIDRNHLYHGFPPKGFTLVNNPDRITGKEPLVYAIQADCLPTQALENVLQDRFSLIDCPMAVQIAMYTTLREILGDLRFNSRFSGKGPSPLSLQPNVLKTPLNSLEFIQEPEVEAPCLADNVYFSNVPLYNIKQPNGESRGLHALCITPSHVKEKKYIAWGTSEDGKTEGEMYDFLIAEFNAQRIEPSLISTEKLNRAFASTIKARDEHFFRTTKKSITDFTIDRNYFEAIIKKTDYDEAGLYPIVKRLNIETILKNLT